MTDPVREAFADMKVFDPEVVNFVETYHRARSPDELLMLAVLEQAITDLMTIKHPHTKANAYYYLESRETDWPFRFQSICDHFGFDANAIRARLGIGNGMDAAMATEYPPPFTTRSRILAILQQAGTPLKVSEIRSRLGEGNIYYIDEQTRRLVDEGLVERRGWGVYQANATEGRAA